MSRVVAPQTLGIFGGGQLGRMMCVAAQALGFRVRVLDPDPHCPAAIVANETITAAFDDPIAAQRLALGCVAVTVDLEKVGLPALDAAAVHAPVRPSSRVLELVQDRAVQRAWLREQGFPMPPVRPCASGAEVRDAVEAFGFPTYVKATRGGYDGRGQVRVDSAADLPAAMEMADNVPVVAEANVPYVAELSVQVARSSTGEVACFPPAWNHHVDQILQWTLLPAPVSSEVADAARDLGARIAEALDVVGLLTVELFLLPDHTLWVNELAPRPHNSFHTTLSGTDTSQFAQAVRAVTGLTLGSPRCHTATVVANLLGDLWLEDGTLGIEGALAVPGVDVTVYGKRMARPARKMGHLTATGATADEALERATEAMARLGAPIAR